MIKYAIVTPVRNEETYVRKTIESVISQTIKPIQWIIVNDGSTDGTKDIIERYIIKFPWIKMINLEDRGFRPGQGSADVFNKGLRYIESKYDFIVHLDGDVSFSPDYFEKIFEKFSDDPKLGIANGKSYYLEKGKLILYRSADTSTMGPTKVYRKQCFKDIGGSLIESVGWDMIDDLKAKMCGWRTRSFNDIKFIHHRKIGTRDANEVKIYIEQGEILYFYGYHLLFIIAKGIYRMFEKPYIIIGLAIIFGYFKALVQREKQIEDKEMIEFLRSEQLGRLFFKARNARK